MTDASTQLFVAWQDAVGRGIYPVARLSLEHDGEQRIYEFRYIRGALQAQERGFQPFLSFPDLRAAYRSTALFPFFTNRVMPPGRPDYAGYVAELGLSAATAEPIALLARSGGVRVTDRLEVYAPPRFEAGACELHFLLRGVRHLPPGVEARVARLEPGERLYVMRDVQNEFNAEALLLRTADKVAVGYVPDLLVDDLSRLSLAPDNPVVTIERVNAPPSPAQHRVLCRLHARWPAGLRPFASERYAPLDA